MTCQSGMIVQDFSGLDVVELTFVGQSGGLNGQSGGSNKFGQTCLTG